MLRHTLTIFAFALSCFVPLGANGFALRTNDDGKLLLWGQRSLTVEIDTRRAKDLPGAADEVQAAFGTWLAAGVPFTVAFSQGDKGVGQKQDGRNTVSWVEQGWTYGEEVVGITVAIYAASSGKVVETDMLFNRQHHRWSTGVARAGYFDLRNVATHEAGHFFGLGHSSVAEATMWGGTPPEEQCKRTLHADDRDGIAALIEAMGATPQKPVVIPQQPASLVTHSSSPPLAKRREALGCRVGSGGSGGLLFLLCLVFCIRRRVFLMAAIVGSFLAAGNAGAATAKYLSADDLRLRAEVVRHGKVTTVMSVREKGMFFTYVQVEEGSCLKGACGRSETIRVPGGRIGDKVMVVPGAPRFSVGQEVLVYARRLKGKRFLSPLGLAQGVFYRRGKALVRDLRGLCLLRSGGAHFHAGVQERKPSELGLRYFKGRILRLSK